MVNDTDGYRPPRRGTAVLLMTMVLLASYGVIIVWPRPPDPMSLSARVAIVDSGITPDASLAPRIVVARSFINRQFGYPFDDNSTTDSEPKGSPHGTYVARLVATQFSEVALVNAKVVSSDNIASVTAIAEAIYWAVREAGCTVINLSIGGSPTNGSILEDAVRWAFRQGVCVVAAAGNTGQTGVAGTSVESPALCQEAIAVAAVDSAGNPFSFSARGPLRGRIAKPDISALGSYSEGGGATLLGTSFAAPRVSAVAAAIIARCAERGWRWTPGMVKALLLASARHLEGEDWEVGAGLVDPDAALEYLEHVPRRDRLPLVVAALPTRGPYEFERWFVNSTYTIPISVFASSNVTFDVFYTGSAAPWIHGPPVLSVNQTGLLIVQLNVVSDVAMTDLRSLVTLVADEYLTVRAQFSFDLDIPRARVLFDVSHSLWWLDSVYGQFRYLYCSLTRLGIAVEEIDTPGELSAERLARHDAVLILDPCTRVHDAYGRERLPPMQYTAEEIQLYHSYFADGGSLLVAALDNNSLNVPAVNRLLLGFNVSLDYGRVPEVTFVVGGIASTALVSDLSDHPVTRGVSSFDHNGCTLNHSLPCYSIARVQIRVSDRDGNEHLVKRSVVVGRESESGSRLIVSGSNFFLDNWAFSGLYQSDDNERFAVQCVLWLVGLL